MVCVEHSGVNNMESNYIMRLEQSMAEGGLGTVNMHLARMDREGLKKEDEI